MTDDFPIKLLSPKTYSWFVLALIMILGALFGWAMSYLLPPIYEARAILTGNMEIVRNGDVTEIMVDSQMTVLGSHVYNEEIVQKVIENENSLGNPLDFEEFKRNASFERQMMNTVLKYRDHDPAIAQRIANAWADEFRALLLEAYPYGIAVSAARNTIVKINNCQKNENAQKLAFCIALNQDEEKKLIKEAQAVIAEKSAQSLGLTSALSIGEVIPADQPDEPVRFTRGRLILAGTLIGFAAGIMTIELKPSRRQEHA